MPKATNTMQGANQESDRQWLDVATKNPVRKFRDRQRIEWHRTLTLIETDIPASVLRYANWIMHDTKFKFTDFGYIEISSRRIASELKMSHSTAKHARKWLVARGWLIEIPRHGLETQRHRFAIPNFWAMLCGGLEDLTDRGKGRATGPWEGRATGPQS